MAGELNITNLDTGRQDAVVVGDITGVSAGLDSPSGVVQLDPLYDLMNVLTGQVVGVAIVPGELPPGSPLPDGYHPGVSVSGWLQVRDSGGFVAGWSRSFDFDNLGVVPVESMSMTLADLTVGMIGQPNGSLNTAWGGLLAPQNDSSLSWWINGDISAGGSWAGISALDWGYPPNNPGGPDGSGASSFG